MKTITGLLFFILLLVGCGRFGSNSTEVPAAIPELSQGYDLRPSSPPSLPLSTSEAFFDGVCITYVSNEGVLITVRDKKILIDAFFQTRMPKELPELLVNAVPPFDHVDLILVTHDHLDHFDAGMVRHYLQVNQHAIVISTAQIAAKLPDFKDRVISLDASEGNPDQIEMNDIQVKALYLTHGKQAGGVINFGYLISVHGIKLFHAGDIDDTDIGLTYLEAYKLTEENIDIAFLPYWMLTMVDVRTGEDGIGSRYVIPIHYEFYEIPFIAELTKDYHPNAIFFEYNLQRWIMPEKD